MKLFTAILSLTASVAAADYLRGDVPAPSLSDTSPYSSNAEAANAIHELNRRRKKPKKKDSADSEADGTLGGHLLINHVNGDFISDDSVQAEVDVIEKSFVDAYNEAHPDGEFMLTSMTLEKEVIIPEDASSFNLQQYYNDDWPYPTYYSFSWVYRFGWHCRLCREDDDWDVPPVAPVVGEETKPVETVNEDAKSATSKPTFKTTNHRDFEDIFCLSLKKSNLKEFKTTNACSILFDDKESLESEGDNLEKRKKKKKDEGEEEDGSGQGALVIEHVNIEARKDLALEVAEVEEAFVAAYNAAHPDSDYSMVSMTVESQVEIPEEVFRGPSEGGRTSFSSLQQYYNDDWPYPTYYSFSWVYRFGWHCRLCREDDDWDVPPVSPVVGADSRPEAVSAAHRDFESIMCRTLKHSKLGEFSDVDGCSVTFDYSKTDMKNSAVIKEA